MIAEFVEKVSRLKAYFEDNGAPLCVNRVVLFGSVARGEATKHSDIDILVTFTPYNLEVRSRFLRNLPLWVDGEYPEVDIVPMDDKSFETYEVNGANMFSVFVQEVKRDGVLLWERQLDRSL